MSARVPIARTASLAAAAGKIAAAGQRKSDPCRRRHPHPRPPRRRRRQMPSRPRAPTARTEPQLTPKPAAPSLAAGPMHARRPRRPEAVQRLPCPPSGRARCGPDPSESLAPKAATPAAATPAAAPTAAPALQHRGHLPRRGCDGCDARRAHGPRLHRPQPGGRALPLGPAPAQGRDRGFRALLPATIPHLLDEIGLPERVNAGLRLLEASGKPEPWQEASRPAWQQPR